MSAPQVISVRLLSKGREPEVQTMRKNTTKTLPKTAVKLSPTVWFMEKTGQAAGAQVFTVHQGWAYFMFTKAWNAGQMLYPEIEVLS